MTNPVRFSSVLRSVADRIDRSRSPSRTLVAAELRRVLATMTELDVPASDVISAFYNAWTELMGNKKRYQGTTESVPIGGPSTSVTIGLPKVNVALFKRLLDEVEWSAELTIDKAGLATLTGHVGHDADVLYEAPEAEFKASKAVHALIDDIKSAISLAGGPDDGPPDEV